MPTLPSALTPGSSIPLVLPRLKLTAPTGPSARFQPGAGRIGDHVDAQPVADELEAEAGDAADCPGHRGPAVIVRAFVIGEHGHARARQHIVGAPFGGGCFSLLGARGTGDGDAGGEQEKAEGERNQDTLRIEDVAPAKRCANGLAPTLGANAAMVNREGSG